MTMIHMSRESRKSRETWEGELESINYSETIQDKNKPLCQNWPLRKYIQRKELEVTQISPINVYFNDNDNDYILMATNN